MAIHIERKISLNPKSFTFQSAILLNLALLRSFSKYIGLPIIVKNDRLSVDNRIWKRCLWFSSLTVLYLRTVFVIGTVGLSLTVDRFSNPLFTPLYLFVVNGAVLALFVGIFGLTCHTEDFVLIWNSILKYQSKVKPLKIVVWILHVFPLSIPAMVWVTNMFLALHFEWLIQFRFGVTWALAEGHLRDGWWGYYALVAVCTLLDFWSFFALGGIISVSLPLHIFFMETWPRILGELVQSSRKCNSCVDVNLIWKPLQELLVMLQIFNVANAHIVLSIKFVALFLSISCGSAMILMRFRDNFLLLIIMSYFTFAAPFTYPALYYNAYSVSKELQRAKFELLGIPKTKIGQYLMERRLRSVPTKGVWVGSLRTFERESILIFFDFVIRTVMSIVLASN